MKRPTCLVDGCAYQPWFPDGLCRRHGIAAGSDIPVTAEGFVVEPDDEPIPKTKPAT